MHKGRSYCYHPLRWSGNGWFWPGFIPWKMALFPTGVGLPPWDYLNSVGEIVSAAGVPDTDRSSMAYEWDFNVGSDPVKFLVTMDTVGTIPSIQCRWRASIWHDGTWWCTAYALQAYPQIVVSLPSWDYSLPCPPYLPDTVPMVKLYPATWDLSGSPYSEPEHPW